jgi:hypothetical protein
MKAAPAETAHEESIHQIDEGVPDPYKANLIEPAVCPICFAVFKEGRWQWAAWWPIDSHQRVCQACHRARDRYPAGIATIRGGFAMAHRAEILSMARRLEQHEKFLYPLHRIMGIEERPDSIVINTTDIDLPRVIGKALQDAYGGDLETVCPKESYSVRVNWTRQELTSRNGDRARSETAN